MDKHHPAPKNLIDDIELVRQLLGDNAHYLDKLLDDIREDASWCAQTAVNHRGMLNYSMSAQVFFHFCDLFESHIEEGRRVD